MNKEDRIRHDKTVDSLDNIIKEQGRLRLDVELIKAHIESELGANGTMSRGFNAVASEIEKMNTLIQGGDDPTKSIIIRLDRVTQLAKGAVAAIGVLIGGIITFFIDRWS